MYQQERIRVTYIYSQFEITLPTQPSGICVILGVLAYSYYSSTVIGEAWDQSQGNALIGIEPMLD
jgi:hypothetical protein